MVLGHGSGLLPNKGGAPACAARSDSLQPFLLIQLVEMENFNGKDGFVPFILVGWFIRDLLA